MCEYTCGVSVCVPVCKGQRRMSSALLYHCPFRSVEAVSLIECRTRLAAGKPPGSPVWACISAWGRRHVGGSTQRFMEI